MTGTIRTLNFYRGGNTPLDQIGRGQQRCELSQAITLRKYFALHKILSRLMLDQSYGHYKMVTTGEVVNQCHALRQCQSSTTANLKCIVLS